MIQFDWYFFKWVGNHQLEIDAWYVLVVVSKICFCSVMFTMSAQKRLGFMMTDCWFNWVASTYYNDDWCVMIKYPVMHEWLEIAYGIAILSRDGIYSILLHCGFNALLLCWGSEFQFMHSFSNTPYVYGDMGCEGDAKRPRLLLLQFLELGPLSGKKNWMFQVRVAYFFAK